MNTRDGTIAASTYVPPPVHAFAGEPDTKQHILDGVSLVPLLKNRRGPRRKALYFHMPLCDALWGTTPCGVIRKGHWKRLEFFGDYVDREDNYRYIVAPRVEFYNLREDIDEKRDLAKARPEKTRELLNQLRQWRRSLNAPMPTQTPNFDPSRAMKCQGDVVFPLSSRHRPEILPHHRWLPPGWPMAAS